MSSVEVWLVRHGQSVWNVEGRLTGLTDIALTEKGRDQARRLGARLVGERFDSVLSSDRRRALETARLAWGEPDRVEPRLQELHFGAWEGTLWAAMTGEPLRQLRDFDDFQAPGGEHLRELEARVFGCLDALPPGRHLLFTHGGVFRAVLRAAGADRFVSNCAVAALHWSRRELLWLEEDEPRSMVALPINARLPAIPPVPDDDEDDGCA